VTQTTQHIISAAIMLALLLVAVIILNVLVRRGVFSETRLSGSPPRLGNLNISDIVVGLGAMLIGASAATLLGRRYLDLPQDVSEVTADQLLTVMLLSQSGMAVAAFYVVVRAATGMADGLEGFGLGPRRLPRALRTGVLGGNALLILTAAMSMLITLTLTLLNHPPRAVAHSVLRAIVVEPAGATRTGLILTAIVAAPVLEEIVFRGLLQTSLISGGIVRSRWMAIVIASVVFTFTHLSAADVPTLPVLFVLSLGLGYLYERTGSLWADITAHVMFNGVQIAVALAFAGSEAQPV
jgi:hypothetical protein